MLPFAIKRLCAVLGNKFSQITYLNFSLYGLVHDVCLEAPLAEKELGCGSPPATEEHVAEAATRQLLRQPAPCASLAVGGPAAGGWLQLVP